jgi:hypothetical protein
MENAEKCCYSYGKWRLINFSVVTENCQGQELCSSFILFSYPSSLNLLVSVILVEEKKGCQGKNVPGIS